MHHRPHERRASFFELHSRLSDLRAFQQRQFFDDYQPAIYRAPYHHRRRHSLSHSSLPQHRSTRNLSHSYTEPSKEVSFQPTTRTKKLSLSINRGYSVDESHRNPWEAARLIVKDPQRKRSKHYPFGLSRGLSLDVPNDFSLTGSRKYLETSLNNSLEGLCRKSRSISPSAGSIRKLCSEGYNMTPTGSQINIPQLHSKHGLHSVAVANTTRSNRTRYLTLGQSLDSGTDSVVYPTIITSKEINTSDPGMVIPRISALPPTPEREELLVLSGMDSPRAIIAQRSMDVRRRPLSAFRRKNVFSHPNLQSFNEEIHPDDLEEPAQEEKQAATNENDQTPDSMTHISEL